jgi:hypothetical protein
MGAVAGGADAAEKDIVEREKEAALARRDAALASLNRENSEAHVDYAAKSALENAGPLASAKSKAAYDNREKDAEVTRLQTKAASEGKDTGFTLAQGQTRYNTDGKLVVAAPNQKRELTESEEALNTDRRQLIQTQIAKLKEQTAKIASGGGPSGKEDKPVWKEGPKKDEDGNPLPPTLLDANSPLMQEWVKAEPATPGSKKSSFGPFSWGKDEGEKPEVKGHWVTKNRQNNEPANISDVYKGYSDRADSAEAGQKNPAAGGGAAQSSGTNGGAGAWATIPQGAIDRLKANPGSAAAFDARFGAGASKRYI